MNSFLHLNLVDVLVQCSRGFRGFISGAVVVCDLVLCIVSSVTFSVSVGGSSSPYKPFLPVGDHQVLFILYVGQCCVLYYIIMVGC